MLLALTNKSTGKKILVELDGGAELVEENADGVSTNVVFGGGSMVRNVTESVADIQAACGALTPADAVAVQSKSLLKRK